MLPCEPKNAGNGTGAPCAGLCSRFQVRRLQRQQHIPSRCASLCDKSRGTLCVACAEDRLRSCGTPYSAGLTATRCICPRNVAFVFSIKPADLSWKLTGTHNTKIGYTATERHLLMGGEEVGAGPPVLSREPAPAFIYKLISMTSTEARTVSHTSIESQKFTLASVSQTKNSTIRRMLLR